MTTATETHDPQASTDPAKMMGDGYPTSASVSDALPARGASNVIHLVEPHEIMDDRSMGQVFIRGTIVGIPAMWLIGLVLLFPVGFPVALYASFFLAVASGPFFGATVFLMAKIVREEHRAR